MLLLAIFLWIRTSRITMDVLFSDMYMKPAYTKVVLSIFLSALVLIAIQMVHIGRLGKEENISGSSFSSVDSAAGVSRDTDTDGDGVPDWKEELLGLNPNEKDSDRDGVSDLIEAEQIMGAFDGERDESGLSVLPFGLFPEIDKVIRGDADAEATPSGTSGAPKESVSIFSITPSEGRVGTRILIEGEGFEKRNTIYTGYGRIDNAPSFDGKSISVAVSPDLPLGMEFWNAPIVYWFYVENGNGLSNRKSFQLITR